MQVIEFMSNEEEGFQNDGDAFKLRILNKLANDEALSKTRIEARLAQDFRPVDLKKRLYHAAAQAQTPFGAIEDDSFHEVLSVSYVLNFTILPVFFHLPHRCIFV